MTNAPVPDLKVVGGAVRDRLDPQAPESHDVDLVSVHPDGFVALQDALTACGCEVVKVNEGTMVLVVLLSPELQERFGVRKAEVAFARFDGPSSDGRHPDWTRPGTQDEDMERRDFTVNAMVWDDLRGVLLDNHGGQADLASRTLRFVGDPMSRVREDALRVLRALRFAAVKGFTMDPDTWAAVNSDEAADLLAQLPVERVDSEVTRMLSADPVAGMRLLVEADKLHRAVFRDGFHVTGSLKVRKVAQ